MNGLIEHVDIPTPHGILEALLKAPPEPRGTVVLCHPHPRHGGTMHSKVIFHAARGFESEGFATLRFNFRGVGRSTGDYDEGRGEIDDVGATLHEAERRFPGLPLTVAGFSFGAAIGMRAAAAQSRLARLVGFGLPVVHWKFDFLRDCATPKWVIQGSADEFGPLPQVEESMRDWLPPKQLLVVPGAGHFFAGHLAEFTNAVRTTVRDSRDSGA